MQDPVMCDGNVTTGDAKNKQYQWQLLKTGAIKFYSVCTRAIAPASAVCVQKEQAFEHACHMLAAALPTHIQLGPGVGCTFRGEKA